MNAWCVDVQNRCCTCFGGDENGQGHFACRFRVQQHSGGGGYRNSDLIDFTDNNVSFMFQLGAGGGAVLLRKNYTKNLLLGSHLISDGSIVHTAGAPVGGTVNPATVENISQINLLRLMDAVKMKNLLNHKSMDNWMRCVDEALRKSGMTRADIGYMDILHIKPSGHKEMLHNLGMSEDQTVYLSEYGHIGQVDQILSLKLGLEQGKVKDGTVVAMIAAGIGYTWAASVVKWGDSE